MPTALIADDEPALRERLSELLRAAWPGLKTLEAGDGLAALELLNRERPDVAFLDIRMPGLTGLELAASCASHCHVVFVTAYDEHAIAAFEAGVVDYVLKPIEPARFVKVVDRLKARMGTVPVTVQAVLRALAATKPAGKLQWLQASLGNQIRFIHLDEVVYFQSDAKYTRVVTQDAEALIRIPIKELAGQLDAERFWQTHRGSIVNIQFLLGVVRETDGTMQVVLRDRDERLPVSQPYHHLFRQM
ncbi:MAG: LytTR family DNA-binding domain-containing protein [Burkholderiales bacterium]